jgi:hypothetical protein
MIIDPPDKLLRQIMTALWIFLAFCPVALTSLVAFASHIDPLSGRWREAKRTRKAPRRRDAYRARAARVIACSESPSTGS